MGIVLILAHRGHAGGNRLSAAERDGVLDRHRGTLPGADRMGRITDEHPATVVPAGHRGQPTMIALFESAMAAGPGAASRGSP